jgi:hypothetical protein
MAQLPSLDAFSSFTQDRGESGATNDAREKAIEMLFSENHSERVLLTAHPVHGARWQAIQTKFQRALTSFMATGGHGVPVAVGKLSSVKRQGGRTRNYDFDGVFVCANGSELTLKIELKRGKSIYDQPQFLQLYAKRGDMVTSAIEPYSSWFYDNHMSEVALLAGVAAPTKAEYLSKCFGTNYDVFEHTKVLYQLDVGGSPMNKKLQAVAFKSIDGYLSKLERNSALVDLGAIQRRLDAQLGKLFVSWDPGQQDFVVEVFSQASMTLSGNISFKKRRDGQRSCLVVTNMATQPIQALLRWKNHNCLLGPAWQISLASS